ncbi:MAG: class I SAM-dependent methyltransferase family protein [Candidatus Micrarchaeota archaeon]|nr:class I SAM-dependent methyltransferase family protein [Candidatus Micrarchaeota archaeon]
MYDIIGSREGAVAVIDSEEKLDFVLKHHKNVKSVLLKLSGRSGTYRTYTTKLLWGSENTEVIHKEHGLRFAVDPAKVYFSPREAAERQRIAELVREGERVLVMFSGISCLGITIAARKKCEVVCVEINPVAHEYAEKNLSLNKLKGTVKNILGDARDVCPALGVFDRILMPLPESSFNFIDTALKCSKPGTVIHIYSFSSISDFSDVKKSVPEDLEIIGCHRVLPYAPGVWKVRLDVLVPDRKRNERDPVSSSSP